MCSRVSKYEQWNAGTCLYNNVGARLSLGLLCLGVYFCLGVCWCFGG